MKDSVILLTLFYISYHSLVSDLYFDSGYFTEDGRVCVTLFRLTLNRHVSHVILLLLSERHNHLHLTCENRKKCQIQKHPKWPFPYYANPHLSAPVTRIYTK